MGKKTKKVKKVSRTNLFASYEKRVLKGIKWLNKNKPGWYNKFDFSMFDLKNVKVCVLGQAYGDYWKVVSSTGSKKLTVKQAVDMGFNEQNDWGGDGEQGAWDLLSQIWWFHIAKLKNGSLKLSEIAVNK